MNEEILERLLIDRASGALSPDVEELLAAHLRQNPDAQEAATQIADILGLARVALARQSGEVLTLPKLPEPARAHWVPDWAWKMAACFMCGLALGGFAFRTRTAPAGLAQAVPTAPLAALVVPAAPDTSGIWSVRRYRAGLAAANPRPEKPIIWQSPLKKPTNYGL